MAEKNQSSKSGFKTWHMVLTFIIGVGIGLASVLAPAFTQQGRIFDNLDDKASDEVIDTGIVFTKNELRELDENIVHLHGKVGDTAREIEQLQGMFFTEKEGMFFVEGAEWNELGKIMFEDGKVKADGEVLIDTGMFFNNLDDLKVAVEEISQGMEETCSACMFY